MPQNPDDELADLRDLNGPQHRALLIAAADARVLAMGVLMERYGLTRTKAALLLAKIATRSSVPVEALASRVVNSVGLHRENRQLSAEN